MAITVDSLKNMSPKVKVLLLVVACALIAYFYYFFLLQSALEKKTLLQTKLSELQELVDRQERIASQKERYIKEVAALKSAFQVALAKLPWPQAASPPGWTSCFLSRSHRLRPRPSRTSKII
jgi:Tfp pilus assembly protein PilO